MCARLLLKKSFKNSTGKPNYDAYKTSTSYCYCFCYNFFVFNVGIVYTVGKLGSKSKVQFFVHLLSSTCYCYFIIFANVVNFRKTIKQKKNRFLDPQQFCGPATFYPRRATFYARLATFYPRHATHDDAIRLSHHIKFS